ncbi:MAG TPA: hypothetical protein VFE45_10430, partial [Coriobacteriia bacterium]|nr:hypothetical protein [Coriobacteriia bacterium]
MEQFEAAKARSAEIDARLEDASAALDRAVADERASRDRLRSRAIAMYRTADLDPVSVLLGAATFQDFVARWELLARIAEQDAENLRALKVARLEAKKSAEELLELQAESARALDTLADEVARTKKELAASEASLRAYEARMAAAVRAKTQGTQTPSDSTPQVTGSKEWKTAVA